jgi:DNA-binding transcriptional MerR regulator
MSSSTPSQPVQEFFSIGEVCQLTDLKPHVLRYWESQFRFLNPAKNRSGNRVYQRREIELIMLVKHLLYTEKYTIEGARQKIEQYRRSGELKPEARRALATETVKAPRGAQVGARHTRGRGELNWGSRSSSPPTRQPPQFAMSLRAPARRFPPPRSSL